MKLQSALAHAREPSGPCQDDDLFRGLGDLAGLRALVIGADVEVMCSLIRRGCGEVMERELHDRLPANSADLVIVPAVTSLDAAMCAIALACRVLSPGGRLMLRLRAGRPLDPTLRCPEDDCPLAGHGAEPHSS